MGWLGNLIGSADTAVVAVRVDPNDHSRVAIDFDSQVPEVTLAANADPNSVVIDWAAGAAT